MRQHVFPVKSQFRNHDNAPWVKLEKVEINTSKIANLFMQKDNI